MSSRLVAVASSVQDADYADDFDAEDDDAARIEVLRSTKTKTKTKTKKKKGRSSRRYADDDSDRSSDAGRRAPARRAHHRAAATTASDEKKMGRCAMEGDRSGVRQYLEGGCDPDATDADHADPYTPLMWACAKGRPDVVQMLIDAGADVHRTERLGWTSLHLAAINATSQRHIRIIQMLLDAGADKSTEDKFGDMPLECCRVGTKPAQRKITETARSMLGGVRRDDVDEVLGALEEREEAFATALLQGAATGGLVGGLVGPGRAAGGAEGHEAPRGRGLVDVADGMFGDSEEGSVSPRPPATATSAHATAKLSR